MVGIRRAMGKLGAAMSRIEWMEEGWEIWNEIGRGYGRCRCEGESNKQVIPFILRNVCISGDREDGTT